MQHNQLINHRRPKFPQKLKDWLNQAYDRLYHFYHKCDHQTTKRNKWNHEKFKRSDANCTNPSVSVLISIPVPSIITPLSSPPFTFFSSSLSFLHDVWRFKITWNEIQLRLKKLQSAVIIIKNLFLLCFSHFLCFLKGLFFNLKLQKRYANKELLLIWNLTMKFKEKGHTSLFANTSSTTCFA